MKYILWPLRSSYLMITLISVAPAINCSDAESRCSRSRSIDLTIARLLTDHQKLIIRPIFSSTLLTLPNAILIALYACPPASDAPSSTILPSSTYIPLTRQRCAASQVDDKYARLSTLLSPPSGLVRLQDTISSLSYLQSRSAQEMLIATEYVAQSTRFCPPIAHIITDYLLYPDATESIFPSGTVITLPQPSKRVTTNFSHEADSFKRALFRVTAWCIAHNKLHIMPLDIAVLIARFACNTEEYERFPIFSPAGKHCLGELYVTCQRNASPGNVVVKIDHFRKALACIKPHVRRNLAEKDFNQITLHESRSRVDHIHQASIPLLGTPRDPRKPTAQLPPRYEEEPYQLDEQDIVLRNTEHRLPLRAPFVEVTEHTFAIRVILKQEETHYTDSASSTASMSSGSGASQE